MYEEGKCAENLTCPELDSYLEEGDAVPVHLGHHGDGLVIGNGGLEEVSVDRADAAQVILVLTTSPFQWVVHLPAKWV